MRVFVTGARGFLGRHLLPQLAGHDVLSLERAPAPPRDNVRVVSGDLAVGGKWQDAVAAFAPEWCIHLAWEGLPDYSLGVCRKNLDSNVALLELLVRSGVRRVVVAGSCWEYGSAVGAVAPDALPVGGGVFASTKHAIRTMLDGVSRDAGFEYRWARIFFVYGPGQRSTSLLPRLRAAFTVGATASLREPTAVHDFVHVEDVTRGLVSLAGSEGPSGVFNLGSGTLTSVGEIANRVAEHYGQLPPFATVTGGQGFCAETSRTTAVCGWRPTIGIAEGVAATLRVMDTEQ